jgi:hypothetical protein
MAGISTMENTPTPVLLPRGGSIEIQVYEKREEKKGNI